VVSLTAISCLALVGATGCGSSDDKASTGGATAAGTTASAAAVNPPSAPIKTEWGQFTLNPKIAQKVKDGQPLNVVLSVVGQATPVYGSQYKFGFAKGLTEAQQQYGVKLDGKLIGPVQADPNEQIAQVHSELSTQGADCLVIESGSNPAFASVIDEAASQGIPVFTTGTDVDKSHRLSTFHTDWVKEGQQAAQAAVEQLKKQGVPIKQVAMTTGASDAVWAQTRMQSFMDEMKKLVPSVDFVTTPKNAPDTTFEPSKVYSQVRAFLQGHPDVTVIYQTDVNGETVDKVISDLGRKGKTFTAGHNVSAGVLGGIANGLQVVTIDQQYVDQAAFAPRACAALLAKGEVLPNGNEALAITPDNIDQAKADFKKTAS
jgi:ribose transport system substrate-binding protein